MLTICLIKYYDFYLIHEYLINFISIKSIIFNNHLFVDELILTELNEYTPTST
jgi:hypothetical protein